jgi:hypothetical protein
MEMSYERMVERDRRKVAGIGEWLRYDWNEAEVYAYGKDFLNDGRWHYKSVWITPLGCIKFDTGGTFYLTRKEAKTLIKSYKTAKWPLVRVSPSEVVRSWRDNLAEDRGAFEYIRRGIIENYSVNEKARRISENLSPPVELKHPDQALLESVHGAVRQVEPVLG